MSLILPGDENGGRDKELSQVMEQFSAAIELFQDMTDQVARGNFAPEKDQRQAIRTLRSVTNLLLHEKQTIEDILKERAGLAGGYAIDFDAARSEIRSRMVGLRDTASSGEVSGQPD